MKTTDLMKAKPSVRSEMIVDAYAHIAACLEQITREIKIHNTWLKQLPQYFANDVVPFPDLDKLNEQNECYKKAFDDLNVQVIENEQNLKHFQDAVEFYKKYGNNIHTAE